MHPLKSKNHIRIAFIYILAIVGILITMSFIEFKKSIFGFYLKPVSVFSDILPDDHAMEKEFLFEAVKLPTTEICPQGIVCFRNYTAEKFPLDSLVEHFLEAKAKKAKVRIAWYGDSFSDGDILVSDLRDTLQSLYGGNGVGFVPITSEAPGFRKSVVHSFSGWNTTSLITNPKSGRFGINGFSYTPDSGNFVCYAGTKHFKHTHSFSIFRLFYASAGITQSNLLINKKDRRKISIPPSKTPGMLTVDADTIWKIRAGIAENPAFICYGASLEDKTGIYVDNFSIKGNSGLGLQAIPDKNLVAFDSLLHYDLIVLQFGLNVTNMPSYNFSGYVKGMTRLVTKLKKAFPSTPILLISVSDRSHRRQGQFVTMPVIPYLIEAQEKIAYENKLVFWNLFEAMGGEDSMTKFANSKPALANKDYTHLNYAGGRKLGISLARSFVYEVEKYEKRRKCVGSGIK